MDINSVLGRIVITGNAVKKFCPSSSKTLLLLNKYLVVIFIIFVASNAHAITFNLPSTDPDGTFVLSWSGGGGIQIAVMESLNGGSTWTGIYAVNGSSSASGSHTITRSPGTYHYKLLNCASSGSGVTCGYTAPKAITITAPVPGAPGTPAFGNINSGGDSDGSYRVSWSAASGGPTRYEWQEKKDSGSWSSPVSSGTTLYVDRSGRTNGVWSYQVRACNTAGCSNYSAIASLKVALTPGVPASISPSPQSDGSISVSWGASSGSITEYDLDYKRNNGSYVGGYNGLALNTSFSGMPIGSYIFQVRACKTVSGFTSCSGWRVSSVVTQSVGTFHYQYDELGRLIQVVDVENRETEYDYDKADNRLEKTVEQLP